MAAAVTALFRAVGHQGVVTASNRVSASMKAVGTAHVQTTGKIAKFRAEVSRSLAVSSRFAKMHGTTIPGQLRVFVAHLHRTSPAVQRFATTTRAAFASIRAGIDDVVKQVPFLGAALTKLGPKGTAAALGIAAFAAAVGGGAMIGDMAAMAAVTHTRLVERAERFAGAGRGRTLAEGTVALAIETGQDVAAMRQVMGDVVTMGAAYGRELEFVRGLAGVAGAGQQQMAALAPFITQLDAAEALGRPVEGRALLAAARGTELIDILKEHMPRPERLRADATEQIMPQEIVDAVVAYEQTKQAQLDIAGAADDYLAAKTRLSNEAMMALSRAGEKLAPTMIRFADALRAATPAIEAFVMGSTLGLRMVGGILGWGQRTFNNPPNSPTVPREDNRRTNAKATADAARAL